MPQKTDPFEMAKQQVEQGAKYTDASRDEIGIIKRPDRTIEVSVPVKMDDGSIKVFSGYRVQHNKARGPYKGGLRFHPEETLETVKALAMWMTWKSAVVNIPYGGAKGGIVCDTKEMSDGEIERASRVYVDRIYKYIGPNQDIPAPDVYTDSQVMAWMLDEYEKITGGSAWGAITAKPLELGGSEGRNEATSRGAMFTVREACKKLGMDLQGSTMAIQGFGNVGANLFRIAEEMGVNVVATSDTGGAIYNEEGLPYEEVSKVKRKAGTVTECENTEKITNEELLELDVDILVPAAVENVVDKNNADNIKANFIAEAANGPVTPAADEILFEKDIFQIPDFLCNAGGVVVSYFEGVQNRQGYHWDIDAVRRRLDDKMTPAFDAVYEKAEKENIHMRDAAYAMSLKRVLDAMRCRGFGGY